MPLARINLASTHSPETVHAISDVIYDAMTTTANVPADDRYQIITRHAPGELVYPAQGYLGIDSTADIVFIQITWSTGRTVETRKAFYRAIADGIHAKTGIRKQDVWINLVEVNREDWSFGNGEMQYAAK